jgi:two-component system sensor histidine kinase MtrB
MTALARPPRWLLQRWRESLKLRVVSTTMVLGVVATALLGGFLYAEIARGLEQERIRVAQNESLTLTAQAQQQWDASDATDVGKLNNAAKDIMEHYLKPPGPSPSRYVIMSRSVTNTSTTILADLESTGEVGRAVVTPELRQAVADNPTRQQTQISDIVVGSSTVPAVMVGSSVEVPRAGRYDLYFIYPMEQEQATMALIARAFSLAVAILTVLLGAIAWVVTRQVVSPVRRAAGVAGRLASGELNERMPARGADDLALLATSFNAMADSLQTKIGELEGLSLVQQRFVSDVSHELRTPLTTIRMAVDLIHEARDGFVPTVARSAELLQGELDRFEELLADLLEISRFDAGAAVLDLEPVDLRTTAAKVVEANATLARHRGSTVELIVEEAPAEAEIDERRVERILRNLVVNAIEHGEGRPVTVHVASSDTAVAVLVEDLGVGLRPGESSVVFNRFWRADPARARTSGGTGLGLAISLEDARLHDGWLQAWGKSGAGSRFRLTLPRRAGTKLTTSPLPLTPDLNPVPSTGADGTPRGAGAEAAPFVAGASAAEPNP